MSEPYAETSVASEEEELHKAVAHADQMLRKLLSENMKKEANKPGVRPALKVVTSPGGTIGLKVYVAQMQLSGAYQPQLTSQVKMSGTLYNVAVPRKPVFETEGELLRANGKTKSIKILNVNGSTSVIGTFAEISSWFEGNEGKYFAYKNHRDGNYFALKVTLREAPKRNDRMVEIAVPSETDMMVNTFAKLGQKAAGITAGAALHVNTMLNGFKNAAGVADTVVKTTGLPEKLDLAVNKGTMDWDTGVAVAGLDFEVLLGLVPDPVQHSWRVTQQAAVGNENDATSAAAHEDVIVSTDLYAPDRQNIKPLPYCIAVNTVAEKAIQLIKNLINELASKASLPSKQDLQADPDEEPWWSVDGPRSTRPENNAHSVGDEESSSSDSSAN